MISFKDSIARFYKGFVKFDGRAPRSEYWWNILFQAIVWVLCFAVMIISSEVPLSLMLQEDLGYSEMSILGNIFAVIFIIFVLVNILPNIALAVRRFHDLDQTGWLVLVFFIVGLIPIIGSVLSLAQYIWYIFPGTNGPNKYDDDPYGGPASVFD